MLIQDGHGSCFFGRVMDRLQRSTNVREIISIDGLDLRHCYGFGGIGAQPLFLYFYDSVLDHYDVE